MAFLLMMLATVNHEILFLDLILKHKNKYFRFPPFLVHKKSEKKGHYQKKETGNIIRNNSVNCIVIAKVKRKKCQVNLTQATASTISRPYMD